MKLYKKMIKQAEVFKDYELDSLGAKFSIYRKIKETDIDFRKRIIGYFKFRLNKER